MDRETALAEVVYGDGWVGSHWVDDGPVCASCGKFTYSDYSRYCGTRTCNPRNCGGYTFGEHIRRATDDWPGLLAAYQDAGADWEAQYGRTYKVHWFGDRDLTWGVTPAEWVVGWRPFVGVTMVYGYGEEGVRIDIGPHGLRYGEPIRDLDEGAARTGCRGILTGYDGVDKDDGEELYWMYHDSHKKIENTSYGDTEWAREMGFALGWPGW